MSFLQKCAYIIFIIAAVSYVMILYLPGIPSTDNHVSKDTTNFQIERKRGNSPIKIALWADNFADFKKNSFSKEKLNEMRNYAAAMNKNENSICKAMQMDVSNVYNFEEDTDNYEDDPRHCEFFTTYEDKDVADADATTFLMYTNGYKLSQLPKLNPRKPEQLWVVEIRESPPQSWWRNPLENVFNWTMTYRRDSDVWSPYAKVVRRSASIEGPKFAGNVSMEQWISGKDKLIFGVISHCNTASLREKLITQMNNTGISVDLFGRCGKRTSGDFWRTSAKRYKFFTAFENSLCKDYITEKFWRALKLGIVPVAYGGGNYQLVAPPGSYINARDFKSPDDLMKYLKYLDSNPTEYSKYFQWRAKYRLEKDWETYLGNFCSLCRAVKRYKREGMKARKSYANLMTWWWHYPHSEKKACESKPTNFFS